MAAYNFSESNGFIQVTQTGGNDPQPRQAYPKYEFIKFFLTGKYSTYVGVRFQDCTYTMNPAVDTVIVAGTTYGVGGTSKTADEMLDILSASGIFPTNNIVP